MWQAWIVLLAGIWLIISPYVNATSTLNSVIVGVIVAGLSLWGLLEQRSGATRSGSA